MKIHVAVLVLCLGTLYKVCGQNDRVFADYKVYDLGSSVDLHCNNTSELSIRRPNDTIPTSWMLNLPSLRIINQTMGKYEVSDDMWTLTIHNTTRDDLGQYHCILMDEEDQFYLVTVGLNVEGPYFEDLWKKYDTNVLIAFCALGGFLLLTAAIILLYVFRYQADDDDYSSDSSSSRSSGKVDPPVVPAVIGVKSVPGYTPYNPTDVVKVSPVKMTEDKESLSSGTSGHGSKNNVPEEALQSSLENSDKQDGISRSRLSADSESVGRDNKAFEAETGEKVKDKITVAELHSSESSSVSSDDDKELTSM